MNLENGNHSGDEIARAAAILIKASDGSLDDAVARAERQLEISRVKPFAAAVLEEVRRIRASAHRKQ